MPLPKRRTKDTPKERATRDRVDRARRAQPQRDYSWCWEFAAETGDDVGDVMDDYDEAASIREYDGGIARHDAERLAEIDVRQRYEFRRYKRDTTMSAPRCEGR